MTHDYLICLWPDDFWCTYEEWRSGEYDHRSDDFEVRIVYTWDEAGEPAETYLINRTPEVERILAMR